MSTTKIDPSVTTAVPPLAPTRKKGRPLSFNRAVALNQAMLLFWQHGYEATSLNDLTSTLGVKPSSIYTAFGDKKQLFLQVLEHYMAGPVTSESIIEQAVDGQEAAYHLMLAAADGFTGLHTPKGCLLASSAISCSSSANDVKQVLAKIRLGIELKLFNKIVASVGAGLLPPDTPAQALAGLTMATIQGMSTLARDGASKDKLLQIVHAVMQAWPNENIKLAKTGIH